MGPDAESFPEAVQSVVQGLRRHLGLSVERVREEPAGLLGVPPETPEAWERPERSHEDWRRFTEAVRRFLERERV